MHPLGSPQNPADRFESLLAIAPPFAAAELFTNSTIVPLNIAVVRNTMLMAPPLSAAVPINDAIPDKMKTLYAANIAPPLDAECTRLFSSK